MFEDSLPLKPRTDGRYTFFPNGIFSKKGYILSQKEADWIRNFITTYFSISMCIITIGIFVLHKYLISILLGSIASLFYYIKIRKFTKDKPQINEGMEPFENIKNMSKKTFILMIFGEVASLVLIILFLVTMVKIDKKFTWEGVGFLLFSLLLFTLFSSIIILKLHYSGNPRRFK